MADMPIKPDDGGNGKVVPPLMVQVILDPKTGEIGLNSNVIDKKTVVNLLATGIHIVNNAEEKEKSSIIIPQSRIKL